MKSVESRVERLEKTAAGKALEPGDLLIIDDTDQKVEAVVVKMPTPEADGLARLPDGTEPAIMYESNWRDIDDVFTVVFLDTKPDPQAKLRIRRGDLKHFTFRIEANDPHFPEGISNGVIEDEFTEAN